MLYLSNNLEVSEIFSLFSGSLQGKEGNVYGFMKKFSFLISECVGVDIQHIDAIYWPCLFCVKPLQPNLFYWRQIHILAVYFRVFIGFIFDENREHK